MTEMISRNAANWIIYRCMSTALAAHFSRLIEREIASQLFIVRACVARCAAFDAFFRFSRFEKQKIYGYWLHVASKWNPIMIVCIYVRQQSFDFVGRQLRPTTDHNNRTARITRPSFRGVRCLLPFLLPLRSLRVSSPPDLIHFV